jgi:hypothetical protein
MVLARRVLTVDFPTPPLPLITAITDLTSSLTLIKLFWSQLFSQFSVFEGQELHIESFFVTFVEPPKL